MMKRFLFCILFLLLLVSQQAINAISYNNRPYYNYTSESVYDSLQESKIKKIHYKAENYGKDAREILSQKRFRFKDEKFDNSDFLSHLYFGTGVSIEKISRRESYHYGIATIYSFLIGKDISKSNSISLTLRSGEDPIKNNDVLLKRLGIQLNHHFYLTRCFLNYTPKRIFDISTTVGIGYQRTQFARERANAIYGMFGFKGILRLYDRLHLAIEPYACLSSEGYAGLKKGESSYRYNDSYGVGLSLIYTFKDELGPKLPDKNSEFNRNYIFFEAGPQAMLSNIRFSETLGRYISLGYGFRLDSKFALQFSGGFSSCVWNKERTPINPNAGHPEYIYMANTQYCFGRAEFVANLLTLPNKKVAKRRFSCGISVGYEYGYQWKYTETDTNLSCYYGGLTSAMQLKWILQREKAIYLSPRITFVNFDVPYKEPYEYIEKKYTDKILSLALGLEFGVKQSDIDNKLSDNLEYNQALLVSASFGSNYILERGRYKNDNKPNIKTSLAFEYQPFKYFGVRVKADYSTHKFNVLYNYNETIDNQIFHYTGLWFVKHKVINSIFDFKFDISNMLKGYNPHHKWNVGLYAGMVIAKHLEPESRINKDELTLPGSIITLDMNTPNKPQVGTHLAVNCKYFITRHFGVFGEFGTKIHKNSFISNSQIKYNPIIVLDLEFGLSYKIK